ncbi:MULTISPECIES: hypothetical protein [unclassified Acinetobacter]|mgnify:CR=1 FL=1|uniref:phage tail tube protein n=1 Tax=unclassified Acinetobacter TaxID=196816 RepID=UPI000A33999C|nr:hypothetical protein [Acinetobacter sp. ANC 4218]OTG69913.1 hypothetical protein B9T38_14120 [Acinetobacter sp. ANC 4218]
MSNGYEFLSLQGASHLARNLPGAKVLRELGNQTGVKLTISSDTFSRYESKTGKRQKIGEWTKARDVELEITMDEQKQEDIALAFQAEIKEITTESVQDKNLGTGLKVGDTIKLDGFNISDLMISDSKSVTPTQLVEGQHYSYDASYGKVKILDLTDLTQPLIADYTVGAAKATVIFTMPDDAEYYYLFEGINAISDKKLALELWRFKPSVDGNMDFINEETGEISIKGSALADTTKQLDEKLGSFGRIVYLD